MVDQRAGGLRSHRHNRGGDRGEQVRKTDAEEIENILQKRHKLI